MGSARARFVPSVLVLGLMILATLSVGLPKSAHADSNIGLDGWGKNTCPPGSCTQSQQISTTSPNDVIVLLVETSGGSKITTITDSSGLTFSQRLSYASPIMQTGRNETFWEYYAVTGTVLDSDNITVVADPCCPYPFLMQVIGIQGADTTTIFDKDPSVPATVTCPGAGCGDCTADFNQGTCSASIQTSSIDFVIATPVINDAGPCGAGGTGTPPGFNEVLVQNGLLFYYSVTSVRTTVEFDCNGTDVVAIAMDAVAATSSQNLNSAALDGSGTYINCTNSFYNSTTNKFDLCRAESITTSQPDDLIIVLASCNNCATSGQTPPTFNSVADQSGLTFTERYAFAVNSSLWEWYAFAPSPLANDNVTASFADVNGHLNFHVLAITGVDFSRIFDPDTSLPSATVCTSVSYQLPSCSISFSTSGRDLVLTNVPINDMAGCILPPGWTTNLDVGWWEVDYSVFSDAQSNYTYSCSSSSTHTTEPQAIAVDAIMLTTSPATLYTISWQGYDWDGGSETTLALNGEFVAALPSADSPQNAGAWVDFAVNMTMLAPGSNTLTFTHAQWDCGVSDNVQDFRVTAGSTVVYSNSTELPLSCDQTLTYTFTV